MVQSLDSLRGHAKAIRRLVEIGLAAKPKGKQR